MWSIRKSAELQQLHESIMEVFTPMTQGPASAEHFHSPPPVGASSVSWVQHYPTQSAIEKFDPHITLGYGETGQPGEPFSFRPQSLALCHLGGLVNVYFACTPATTPDPGRPRDGELSETDPAGEDGCVAALVKASASVPVTNT